MLKRQLIAKAVIAVMLMQDGSLTLKDMAAIRAICKEIDPDHRDKLLNHIRLGRWDKLTWQDLIDVLDEDYI